MDIAATAQSPAYAPAASARAATPASSARKSVGDLPPLDFNFSRESLARDTASLADDIGKKFRQLGIRVPPNPILGTDYAGYVRVSNDHPDKEKIERVFADNPDLRDRFAKISSQSSILRAAEHYNQFASEYARLAGNPAAQSALVEAEVARNKATFQMAISIDGAETFFVGLAGVTA